MNEDKHIIWSNYDLDYEDWPPRVMTISSPLEGRMLKQLGGREERSGMTLPWVFSRRSANSQI